MRKTQNQNICSKYKPLITAFVCHEMLSAKEFVCSNRPANSNGMSIEEIKFAIEIGKPVVAVKITNSTASDLITLNVPVISNRKDSLENWISQNV